jgi:hypothetical protein
VAAIVNERWFVNFILYDALSGEKLCYTPIMSGAVACALQWRRRPVMSVLVVFKHHDSAIASEAAGKRCQQALLTRDIGLRLACIGICEYLQKRWQLRVYVEPSVAQRNDIRGTFPFIPSLLLSPPESSMSSDNKNRSNSSNGPSQLLANPTSASITPPQSDGIFIDFCITLGGMITLLSVCLTITRIGDGTLLHLNSLFSSSKSSCYIPPVLSFSRGTLGFLTPFDCKDYRVLIDRIMMSSQPGHAKVDDDGAVVTVCERTRLHCGVIRRNRNAAVVSTTPLRIVSPATLSTNMSAIPKVNSGFVDEWTLTT